MKRMVATIIIIVLNAVPVFEKIHVINEASVSNIYSVS